MARVNGTAGEISRLDNLKPRGLGLLAVRTLPDFGIFLSRKSPVSASFFGADYRRISSFTGARGAKNDCGRGITLILAAITGEYR
jgi:hypothetical protein